MKTFKTSKSSFEKGFGLKIEACLVSQSTQHKIKSKISVFIKFLQVFSIFLKVLNYPDIDLVGLLIEAMIIVLAWSALRVVQECFRNDLEMFWE